MTPLMERLETRLTRLYGDRAADCLRRIEKLIEQYRPHLRARERRWDERDAVLICYADQLRAPAEAPLATLRKFLVEHGLTDLIRAVHILPFSPYSSDDGFSVIDYRQVNPDFGDWKDVAALGEHVDLMFDLVINHVSRHSHWFEHYLAGDEKYRDYFIETDPAADLSAVTRPRSLPLLTPVETSRGERHLWTTFSDDQIDLNFANPDVLVEMLDVLLFYVQQGARIIRLDAIAYLWKQIGTPCIHLDETHEVVKLMRDLVDELAPGTLLLTETNVPHEENISYLGHGDEAHMVYQFSLAPLLLEALLTEDAGPLTEWLASLTPLPGEATYFNFTASHDGIGVRPVEGLLPESRLERLVEAVRLRGGLVNTRRKPDGSDAPYELCVTYFDALGEPGGAEPALHARRFLASQAIMLALRGIPGIYFHSLVGTPNDLQGVARRGYNRAINRRKFDIVELESTLAKAETAQAHVFEGYRRLLAARSGQPAFHPDAAQEVWRLDDPSAVAFLRTSVDGGQRILVLANLGAEARTVRLPDNVKCGFCRELIGGGAPAGDDDISLSPHQVAWLELG